MVDIQKLEAHYTLYLREAELKWICSALRGLEKFRRDEWYELAEKLIRQQRKFHEKQFGYISEELKRAMAVGPPPCGDEAGGDVEYDPALSHEKVAVEIDGFITKLVGLLRIHAKDAGIKSTRTPAGQTKPKEGKQ